MPVNLQNLMEDSAVVTIETSAGDINVTYYPNKLSQKMITQFVAFGSLLEESPTEDNAVIAFHETNTLLISLVKSWDLMQDERTTFPLEPHRLNELPVWLISTITQAIMEHSRPNSAAPRIVNSRV